MNHLKTLLMNHYVCKGGKNNKNKSCSSCLKAGKMKQKEELFSLNEDQVSLYVILSNVIPLNKFLLNHIYIHNATDFTFISFEFFTGILQKHFMLQAFSLRLSASLGYSNLM